MAENGLVLSYLVPFGAQACQVVRDQRVAHRLNRLGLDQFFSALERAHSMQTRPEDSGGMMPRGFLTGCE
jgi:hypothetical protein